MESKHQPAIVVVAYDRPDSLRRLLSTISQIKTRYSPTLIISIDDSGALRDPVRKVAEGFNWSGEKRIILTERKLGLKAHVMRCASMSIEFGSVILLEDDLIVSPAFYDSACSMLDAYAHEERVAGISLYTYTFTETADLSWMPCTGHGPVHLMKQVSSWGQAWTAGQWQRFLAHYEAEKNNEMHSEVPENVRSWPDSSWKKHFIDHVVSSGSYIVYPNVSFSSNCGDPGTHFKREFNQFRSRLATGPIGSELPAFSEIEYRYDAHQELEKDVFIKYNPKLKNLDFQVDLRGIGPLRAGHEELILTTRSCRNIIHSWGKHALPLEMNVLLDIEGDTIKLARKEDVLQIPSDHVERHRRLDVTPAWVHDALGKPLSIRLEQTIQHLTSIAFLNRILLAVFRLFRKP